MPETRGAPSGRDERSPASSPTGRSGGREASGREAPLYGALDLGTNNCRLLIARPARDGGFRVVDSFSRIVRLGEGLTRTGRLDERAMDRAYDALALCAERIARKGVDTGRLSAVATQACRAAENGEAFVERVRRGTGLSLRIIDPAEEARLAVEGCLNLIDPTAEAVLVCVDKPEVADHIVELVKSEFPLTKVLVRAYDRGHSIRLIQAGVDYQVRETFESALRFGERALIELGLEDREAAETIADVRRRDEARLDLQLTGGLKAGQQLTRGNMPTPQPAPYITPRREGRVLNKDEAGPPVSVADGPAA